MKLAARACSLEDIQLLRNFYLQENNFQVRYNACHERGWTDSYLLHRKDEVIGYAAIKGLAETRDRDTVFEFYVLPPYRKLSSAVFLELIFSSGATFIECQTNDRLLSTMMYLYGKNIQATNILFEDHFDTRLHLANTRFRELTATDEVFGHLSEPPGNYVMEQEGKVIATGGYFTHYNFPFADIYLEVQEAYRGKGVGAYLVQELKRACYLAGRVPAARCNIDNIASRHTLEKAGFRIAGFMIQGHT